MEKEQQKARFFGMHIGCPFTHPDFEEPQELKGVATYQVQEPGTWMGYGSCFYHGGWVDIERCQLILKPLLSITDKEAIECAKIANDGINYTVDRNNRTILVRDKDHSSKNVYIDTNPVGVCSEMGYSIRDGIATYDFLRSKCYCLPYRGLDVVKEEWAIIEETK